MQSFHFRQKGITQHLFLFARSKFYDAHRMFAASFCDVHFVYFVCVFVWHLSFVASLRIVFVVTQVAFWKPHNQTFICWGLLIINDNLLMDFINLQHYDVLFAK
jgi:hypothetical protein